MRKDEPNIAIMFFMALDIMNVEQENEGKEHICCFLRSHEYHFSSSYEKQFYKQQYCVTEMGLWTELYINTQRKYWLRSENVVVQLIFIDYS